MIDRIEGWLLRLGAMSPAHDVVILSPHTPQDSALRLGAAFETTGRTSGAGQPVGTISQSGGVLSFYTGRNQGVSRMTLKIDPASTGARLLARTEVAPLLKLIAVIALLMIAYSVLDFIGDGLTALTGQSYRFHPISRLISLIFLPGIALGAGLWLRGVVADDHARLAAFVRDAVQGQFEGPPPSQLPPSPSGAQIVS